MEYTATYNTDIGIRKSTNQDSVAIRIIDTPDGQVAFAIVCDGMGGRRLLHHFADGLMKSLLHRWSSRHLRRLDLEMIGTALFRLKTDFSAYMDQIIT